MHHHHGARGCHWSGIEVVESIEDGVGGNFWVEAIGAEEIQCDDIMGSEDVPLFEWEVFVCYAQPSNKMVFERSNCYFCRVPVMASGGRQLNGYVFIGFEEGNEVC